MYLLYIYCTSTPTSFWYVVSFFNQIFTYFYKNLTSLIYEIKQESNFCRLHVSLLLVLIIVLIYLQYIFDKSLIIYLLLHIQMLCTRFFASLLTIILLYHNRTNPLEYDINTLLRNTMNWTWFCFLNCETIDLPFYSKFEF